MINKLKIPQNLDRSAAKAAGFTLFELMTTLAIVAILVSMALPSFQTLSLNSARTASANELLTAFTAARNEAIKRGRGVTTCPSSGVSNGCLGSGDSSWEQGALVFVDEDNDGSVDANEYVVLYTGALSTQTKIATTAKQFIFRPFNQRSTNSTVFVCDKRGPESARAIVVNVSGRPHIANYGESGISWNCPA